VCSYDDGFEGRRAYRERQRAGRHREHEECQEGRVDRPRPPIHALTVSTSAPSVIIDDFHPDPNGWSGQNTVTPKPPATLY
jgi:hypothetical protein